jgi:PAS domain-containing protein
VADAPGGTGEAAVSFILGAPSLAVFLAAAVALIAAIASLRRTAVHGGVAFTFMMCAVVVWAFGSGMEAGSVGVARKLLFTAIAYAGSANVAPFFLVFAVRYRRREWRPAWWHFALLWLIPAITMVLAATNGAHGLVWTRFFTDPDQANTLLYVHGPWYVISVSYYAALALAAALMIGRATLRTQPAFLGQTAVLLVGLLIPWLAVALTFMPFNPLPGLDLPPISFALTGILVLIGMRSFSFLALVPVARDQLVERMSDGLIVLDAQGRLIDINPAARSIISGVHAEIGSRAEEIHGGLGEAIGALRSGPPDHREISISGDPGRHLELRSFPLFHRAGGRSGVLLVIRDITERKRLENEREALITQLTTALADVKTLSGLLPICSSCKKIRDDTGYWRTLEGYISDHSEAQFSHGLCDDCMHKLYPELESLRPGTSEPGAPEPGTSEPGTSE